MDMWISGDGVVIPTPEQQWPVQVSPAPERMLTPTQRALIAALEAIRPELEQHEPPRLWTFQARISNALAHMPARMLPTPER